MHTSCGSVGILRWAGTVWLAFALLAGTAAGLQAESGAGPENRPESRPAVGPRGGEAGGPQRRPQSGPKRASGRPTEGNAAGEVGGGPTAGPAGPVADAVAVPHRLLVFGPGRPLLLGLQAQLDGVSLREVRREFARRMLTQHDTSGDQQLDQQEAGTIPPLVQPDGMSRPYTLVDTWASVDIAPADDQITLAELIDYLDRTWGSLITVTLRPPRANPTVDLFALLDADRDARLTRAELTAARTRLASLDLNDDETISLDELVTPGLSAPEAAGLRSPLLPLETATQRGEAVARLLSEYGVTPEGSPTRGVPVDRLSAGSDNAGLFDEDRSGRLESAELTSWLEQPTLQSVLGVEFFRRTRGKSRFRLVSDASGMLREQASGGGGRLILDMPGLELELRVAPSRGTAADNRTFFLQKFAQADGDKDRSLSAPEFAGLLGDLTQAGLSALTFEVVDQNRDGQVTEEEFAGMLQQDTSAHQTRVELVLTHQQNSLFEMLGGAGDRRLTLRELLGTGEFLQRFDSDQDGAVRTTDLVGQYRVSAELGQAALFRGLSGRGMRGTMMNRPVPTQSTAAPAGPVWFRKMDLNRDGDVSRREFLGPLPAFEQLDRDGDGLLSVPEAEAAESARRGERPVNGEVPREESATGRPPR